MAVVDDPRRRELARLVRERRRELALSVSAAAREARIDRATWNGVEVGTRETEDYNYAPIERALGWAPGSIDAVLEGGSPTIQQEPATHERTPEPPMDPDVRRWMAILADPDVPEGQKELMREQMRIWERQIEVVRDTATAPSRGQRRAS